MIVVDASVVLQSVLRRRGWEATNRRLQDEGPKVHAPHLLDVEVASVLRRYADKGETTEREGLAALSVLAEFPLRHHPHRQLLPRIWALRHNLTAYDAAYVALAEMLGATLITRDARIARAPGHTARIELV